MFQVLDYQVLKHITVHNNKHLPLLLIKHLKIRKTRLYIEINQVDLVKVKYL